jgi:hypothetical protein
VVAAFTQLRLARAHVAGPEAALGTSLRRCSADTGAGPSRGFGTFSRARHARQAANLWKGKERLWQEVLALAPHDPTFALVDSMPLPVCLFARA